MPETFTADDITLEHIREYVWEIPQHDEMRVPARVLASKPLLEEIADDLTLTQLKNTTHLPGIQKHAICMPDGHQGYGFPVGGVAGIDAETGCISPGAVGYDINCLSGDSEVLLEFGRRLEIQKLTDRFEDERAVVAGGDETVESTIHLFTETDEKTVFAVRTDTGDVIEATADHPFLTPDGMTQLSDLEEGATIYKYPFEGLADEAPAEFTVLDEADFADEDPQLVRVLRERDLLPLKSTDDAFHRLLKLVGYHTGDGSFRGSHSWFYGSPEELKEIQDDIAAIGFTPSRIYDREGEHALDGHSFERAECSVRCTAKAFKQVLLRLGVPEGETVASDFTCPAYLERLADWQRALYLSGFFGAEMSAPVATSAKKFCCPTVSHKRRVEQADAGKQFLQELIRHLNDLGIRTNELVEVEGSGPTNGDTVRLQFGIKNDSENLIQFFSRIGYRYNSKKQRRAALAIMYLKRKEAVTNECVRVDTDARVLADGGMAPRDIKQEFKERNDRFSAQSKWRGQTDKPQSSVAFLDFEDFCEQTEIRDDLSVATAIESITEVGTKTVYDIGVEHSAHNFIANGFVVSNCGVRMMKTNLTYSNLQGREEELVDELFDRVPCGLGGGGVVESSVDTVEEILANGMEWALENGYAVPDDLTHCEDEGVFDAADPSCVSQEAKNRGKNQIGSLGSGNHFLEVQRVTDVYRDHVASEFGLAEDQIVVLIHCGSRGLGHQICTDYLRRIEQAHQGLLAELPDKELAAAPAGSQLADEYYRAMGAAINYAWTNRQLVMHATRQTFEAVFDRDWEALGMELLYDVAHNIAKRETHTVGGADRELFVHRKGATRAFPAGHPEVPAAYRDVGQPVIIPGSMGAGSYVLRGGSEAMDLTFGSTAHGAGRLMSRTQAKQTYWGEDVQDDLREHQQVYVKAQSGATIAEEAPGVYKDVDEVVRVSDSLGIGDRVARTYPVANIKG